MQANSSSRRALAVAAGMLAAWLGLAAIASAQAPHGGRSGHGARVGIAASHAAGAIGPCRARVMARDRLRAARQPTARPRLRRRARLLRRRCARARRPAHDPAAISASAPTSLYWGAWIGDQLTGHQAPWDMTAVTKFEEMVGKPLSLVHFAAPFASCSTSCSFYGFPTTPMENVRQHGAIPFFSWSSQSIPSSTDEPNFQLSDVTAGTYDSYIRSFAEAAKSWGHPFFLRFNWEMNGNWFPWSEGVNGNRAGEYVAAWRHVHDIFSSVGATNATWVWCPNVDPEGRFQELSSLYPGDEYVDWTCLDGYNWGTNPGTPGSRLSFGQLFGPSYRLITSSIAPSKPMLIGEVGASERGGGKAAWIAEMLRQLPTAYQSVRGLMWFEKYDSEMDWPIETSASATAAFAEGIQAPAYRPNDYANLSGGPIPPPS